MTLTKNITAKFAVAAVAVAMAFSAFAPAAQAQTTEELQQMINDLLSQVAQLQAQAGGNTSGGGSSSDVCPYTWTRDLTMGSEGADVMKLQQFLNENPDTRVAPAGSAGSAGMETMYYGPATAAAVDKFQVMYRAEILTPNGLVNPTGYFGASSRAKANDLCITPATTPDEDDDEDGMEDEDEDEEDEDEDFVLGGIANLETFEIDDASDDEIEEGDNDAAIGVITVEFENGDAEISLLDLSLLGQGETDTNGTPRVEPWEAFDTISLWVDGDMIAEVDASDEDDYLSEDAGSLRFSNLGLIAMEDEELEITVAASVQGNLDNDELGGWDLTAVSIRYFDADGVAITEDGTPVTDDTAQFDIVVEGDGEELDLKSSSNDPDATTLILDTDSNEELAFFVFELDASDSEGDIDLETITIDVTHSSTTGSFDDFVDDFYVEIDGQEFDAESYTGTGDTVTLVFDIDGDYSVEEGEEVDVTLFADFAEMETDSEYQGVTISATVLTTGIDAEGVDSITVGGSSQTSETHTLRSEGVFADVTSTDTDTLGQNDTTGVFTIDFEVTAFGEDFYINAAAASTTGGTGVVYSVEGGTTATDSGTLSSTADEQVNGSFRVEEGQTEEFTLTVNITADAPANFRAVLDEVLFAGSEADAIIPANVSTHEVVPVSESRTGYQAVN